MSISNSVSVIIPTYNRAKYVRASLESVFGQTIAPSQIIVVDDGSTDETPRVLRPWLDRIEYIRKENGGKSTALNLALPKVRGEYVWIFDDDDIAYPWSLETQLEVIERIPSAGFVYSGFHRGRARFGDSQRLEVTSVFPALNVPRDELFVALLDQCLIAQQATLVRATCYNEVGPFDERLIRSQDYEMMLRLAYRFQGAMNPEITFVLREHEGIRGSAARTVRFKNRQRVWSEYEREFALRYCRELSLNEYLGKKYQKMSDLTPVEKRKARLIRACIMAHKGLWRQTVADLCEASCDSSSCDELQELERQTIVRIARCHYLVSYEQLLSDSSVIGKLRHDLGKTPLGHDIRTALARGFYEQALATFHI